MPIIVQFQQDLCISNVICDDDKKDKQCVRLRWDKADLVSYCYVRMRVPQNDKARSKGNDNVIM